MNLETESIGDAKVVRVKESRMSFAGLQDFYRTAAAIIDSGTRRLIIDLSPVRYVDSATLGCFMDIYWRMSRRNGTLKLVGLQDRVVTLATMAGLTKLMEVSGEEEVCLVRA